MNAFKISALNFLFSKAYLMNEIENNFCAAIEFEETRNCVGAL